jgi:hypothetical protein
MPEGKESGVRVESGEVKVEKADFEDIFNEISDVDENVSSVELDKRLDDKFGTDTAGIAKRDPSPEPVVEPVEPAVTEGLASPDKVPADGTGSSL